MTISATESRIQYTAIASQTEFNVPFQFQNNSDLKVYLTPSGDEADPVADLLSLNNDYTVVGAGWGVTIARTVTLTVAASPGDIITIDLDMPFERTTDLQLDGSFSAADLNDQFDSLVGMIKQVKTDFDQVGVHYVPNQVTSQTTTQPQNRLPLLPPSSTNLYVWTTNSVGALIAGELDTSEGYSTLRSELLNDESGTDGARIVGYENPSLLPSNTTVHDALDYLVGIVPAAANDVGDITFSYRTAKTGWLLMDDTSIGSSLSSATHNNDIYEDLFTVLWNSTADAQCPVSSGRGGSAAADWAANKSIDLPKVLQRAVSVKGQAALSEQFTTDYVAESHTFTVDSTANFTNGMKVQLSSTGTLPTGVSPSTDYYMTILTGTTFLLSTTPALYTGGNPAAPGATDTLAPSGYYVTLTSDGSGTHTVTVQFSSATVLAEYEGYPTHIQSRAEVGQHFHPGTQGDNIGPATGSGGYFQNGTVGGTQYGTTDVSGTSTPFSVIQPTAYVNAFIKY